MLLFIRVIVVVSMLLSQITSGVGGAETVLSEFKL